MVRAVVANGSSVVVNRCRPVLARQTAVRMGLNALEQERAENFAAASHQSFFLNASLPFIFASSASRTFADGAAGMLCGVGGILVRLYLNNTHPALLKGLARRAILQ
jgi:hypothetical protein